MMIAFAGVSIDRHFSFAAPPPLPTDHALKPRRGYQGSHCRTFLRFSNSILKIYYSHTSFRPRRCFPPSLLSSGGVSTSPSLASDGNSQLQQKKRAFDDGSDHTPDSSIAKKITKLCTDDHGGDGHEELRFAGDMKSGEEAEVDKKKTCQRYLVSVEYIGTKFHGTQLQPNKRTVQGVLQAAFHKFIGQPVSIGFSSRTDEGVHALSNVFHVDAERVSKRKPGQSLSPHKPKVVRKAVNHYLQETQGGKKNEGDVMLIDVLKVPPDFHARFNAKERTYIYRILSGQDAVTIFEKERAWHISDELDLLEMQKACSILVGKHDFSSFRSSGCQAKTPVKTLGFLQISEVTTSSNFPSSMEIRQKDLELPSCSADSVGSVKNHAIDTARKFGERRSHRCYLITARAKSFLYHQVRLLVGLLKSVGTGAVSVDDVRKILDAKTIRAAPPMAPACGLYLANVKYDFADVEVDDGMCSAEDDDAV